MSITTGKAQDPPPDAHIATMTEMREPYKVLERAGGKPVAALRNSALAGCFVPAEAMQGFEGHRVAAEDEFLLAFEQTSERAQPTLDYLKDK